MSPTTGSSFVHIGHRVIAVLHMAGLLALLPASASAQTQCTITPDVTSVVFDAVATGRDTPPGTPISEIRTVVNSVYCPSSPRGYYLQIASYMPTSSVVPGVWETGTPGVGVRVIDIDYDQFVLSTMNSGQYGDFGPQTPWNTNYSTTFRFSFQLIKTGQATASGQIRATGMYNMWTHNVYDNSSSGVQGAMNLGPTPFTARTCTVTNPNITVSLADVSIARLRVVGSSAGSTAFSIALQCETGGMIYITLTDATNPGNVTDVLSLTADSTATGVGIRIRNPSNTLVSFGPDSAVLGNLNQWLAGPSEATTTIPMTAEYFSTGTVSAGTVRAVATFTMSYQ